MFGKHFDNGGFGLKLLVGDKTKVHVALINQLAARMVVPLKKQHVLL